ncbi:hypothetical protein PV04_00779 [Phialophora macrospora]|uniref:DUF1748-domain-containing protein n=1 Tax=Phialophora macrospora TaxID=1851006 RepID=A0A0D2FVW2_9EURO|nr:hypothetical protein PV04_00779 [Phialophora macrospora]
MIRHRLVSAPNITCEQQATLDGCCCRSRTTCRITGTSIVHTHVFIMVLGRLTHYAFDAVLISAFLAGVKRSTGLTPTSIKASSLGESKEVQTWVDRYLGVGEWVMDQSIAVMGSSSWFERRR